MLVIFVCCCHQVFKYTKLCWKKVTIKSISTAAAEDPCWGGITNKFILPCIARITFRAFSNNISSVIWCQNYSCFHLGLTKGNAPLLGHAKHSLGKLGCSWLCWSSVTHWTQPAGDWGGYQSVALIKGKSKTKYLIHEVLQHVETKRIPYLGRKS